MLSDSIKAINSDFFSQFFNRAFHPSLNDSQGSQESMGDALSPADHINSDEIMGDLGSPDEKRNFQEIVQMLFACLDSELQVPPISNISEEFLALMRQSWGPYEVADQWMDWRYRNKEGVERRIRLEVTETDLGATGRELHYYGIDSEGQPVPLLMENRPTINPSDEVISELLKEGDVFFREKASTATFSKGQTIQYIEKNGLLDSLEVHQGTKRFQCPNLKNLKDKKDNCICI